MSKHASGQPAVRHAASVIENPAGKQAATDRIAGARAEVTCRICCNGRHEAFLQVRGYCIVRCLNCGLWYVNPQPTAEELAQFYASYDDGEVWRSGEEGFNRAIRRVILRWRCPGALLDVGCGSGKFLACMSDAGFSVCGIEPSGADGSSAVRVPGIEVFNGMAEEFVAQNVGRKFDVVTMLNVLEHLRDPRQTLLHLKELMPREALLVVVVPDARFHALLGSFRHALHVSDPYWLEKAGGGFLSGFKLPDHLTSFGPETIALLLRNTGFHVVTLRNAPVVWNQQLHRNAAKFLMRSMFGAIQYLTFGHFLFGYSTLLVARKLGAAPDVCVRPDNR